MEPCTPARCQGLLCPQYNSSVCGAGQPCHGLFPLARGALAAAGQVTKEFSSLSARLQDTAQLVSVGTACPLRPLLTTAQSEEYLP